MYSELRLYAAILSEWVFDVMLSSIQLSQDFSQNKSCVFEMKAKNVSHLVFSYIVLKYREKVKFIFGHSTGPRQG